MHTKLNHTCSLHRSVIEPAHSVSLADMQHLQDLIGIVQSHPDRVRVLIEQERPFFMRAIAVARASNHVLSSRAEEIIALFHLE